MFSGQNALEIGCYQSLMIKMPSSAISSIVMQDKQLPCEADCKATETWT